jgi:uncharacterized protein YecT (DUF1311 family)
MPAKTILLILFVALGPACKAQTQSEMNEEAFGDYQKADAELNAVYKEIIKDASEKQKKLLVQAQKDWIKFRDSKCAYEASIYEGGSMQPMVRYSCLEETTKARTEDLRLILEEGH